MFSNISDKIAFYALLATLVLLPIFILPGSQVSVESSKGFILVLGLAVSFIAFLIAKLRTGKIEIPRSWLLLTGFFILLVTLVSALGSSSSGMSFFGIMFDIGTFWFMLVAVVLMFLSALIVREEKHARTILLGISLSLALVFVFQILRFLSPEFFSLGLFTSKTGNLIGSWNSFGLMAGFAVIFSVFLVEFFRVSKSLKWILGILILLALFLVATVNFSIIWQIIGIFSLIIFVYKISIFQPDEENSDHKGFPVLSLILVLCSLLFLISPGLIGNFLPNTLDIQRVEVRPSLSGTLDVSTQILSENPLFGIGPNRWSDAWALYKPVEINNTQFWDVAFSTGSGLIPTVASVSGGFGLLAWLLFIVFILLNDFKILFESIKHRTNFTSVAFFLGGIYFLVASFFYTSGIVIFLLLFAFLGIFIGLSRNSEDKIITINFAEHPKSKFFGILILVLLMLAATGGAFKYTERFFSAVFWSKTFSSEDIAQAENRISRSLALHQNDVYLRTLIQVYFARLNSAVNQETPLTEEEQALIQAGFETSLNAAARAIQYNPDNYLNYQALGLLYATAAGSGASDVYIQAVEAYTKASELNPLNPRLKLEIARAYFGANDIDNAREFTNEALALSPSYIDALLAMAQIENQAGNKAEAVSYAEQALLLSPTNENLTAFVEALKSGRLPDLPVPEAIDLELTQENVDSSDNESEETNNEETSGIPSEEN